MKNKLKLILSCSVLSLSAISASSVFAAPSDNCVNQVSMNFTADNWVNSDNALVSIIISASVPADKVDQVTNAVKSKLAKASGKQDWRLVNLSRNESNSGLISLSATAVNRLSNNELGKLQTSLKTLNQPGEKYEIGNIDHTPDQSTINQSQAELRNKLYMQINQELKALNTAMPNASSGYQIHKINFNSSSKIIQPVMLYAGSNTRGRVAQDSMGITSISSNNNSDGSNNASMSGKITMSAYVTYSAIIPGCKLDNTSDAK